MSLALLFRLPVSAPWEARPSIRGYLTARILLERRERLSTDGLAKAAAQSGAPLAPKFRRILAALQARQQEFEKAAETALSSATQERCLPRRIEQRSFAGISHFSAGARPEAEFELLSVRDVLAASRILRIGMRRLWHYVNFFLGAIAEGEDRAADAAVYFASALTGCPRRARGEVHFLLGQALYSTGSYRAAAQSFARAHQLGHETELSTKWRLASQEALTRGVQP